MSYSEVSPHDFEPMRRWFNRGRCRACFWHKKRHPIEKWTPARPVGDKELPFNSFLVDYVAPASPASAGKGPDLARALLSALDALEAANKALATIADPDTLRQEGRTATYEHARDIASTALAVSTNDGEICQPNRKAGL